MGSGDAAVATDQLHAFNLWTQAIHPFRCLSLTVTPFLLDSGVVSRLRAYRAARAAICLAPPSNPNAPAVIPAIPLVRRRHSDSALRPLPPGQLSPTGPRCTSCRRSWAGEREKRKGKKRKGKKTRDTSHVRQSFHVVLRCDRATNGAALPTLEGNACFSYLASRLLGSMGNPTHLAGPTEHALCVKHHTQGKPTAYPQKGGRACAARGS